MRYQPSNVSGRQQTLQGPLTHHFATCECLWNGQTWLDMNETPSQSMETPAGRIFALLALALGALRTHFFFFLFCGVEIDARTSRSIFCPLPRSGFADNFRTERRLRQPGNKSRSFCAALKRKKKESGAREMCLNKTAAVLLLN
jgi:hypothetical protein